MKIFSARIIFHLIALFAILTTGTSAFAGGTKAVYVGDKVVVSVTASGTQPFTYQWYKNGVAISGATASSYTINAAALTDAASYTAKVTNSAGSTTSDAATLTVSTPPTPGAPDGNASLVTGGAAGQTVTVTNAADLRTYAQATAAYVINVSGTINLGGSVAIKSNKTIQGVNETSGIIGQLDLSSGSVSNVIIRGLNISNASGNGITVRNASGVFITHCSVFDCGGYLIEISNGSDYVTVSWSEFYYSSSTTFTSRKPLCVGLAGSESKPLNVTVHHNWFSDLCDLGMPTSNYGYVHMYNNYMSAASSTTGTLASSNSQLLVERNNYNQTKDPLYKESTGLIRAISNSFTNTTGRTADAGTDSVFTPLYSYEMYHQDDVDAVLPTLAGNTGGVYSTTPASSVATINGPSSAVSPGSSFTLTAAPSGFTGTSYQWRRNNVDVTGATSSTYSVTSMQTANAGTYTVAIGLSSGNVVVSAPLAVTLGTTTGGDGGSSSSSGGGAQPAAASSGGGGGAPGYVYLVALAALGLARAASRRRTA